MPLPGAGASVSNTEPYLLAVADPASTITEIDDDPWSEDNTAIFEGIYHPAGGDVHVHGTLAKDVLSIALGSLDIELNGTPYNYDSEDVTGVWVWTHTGDDIASVQGSIQTENVRMWPGTLRFMGTDFDIWVYDAETITVNGGGGNDTVRLLDSSKTDEFTASPESASMVGPDFLNTAAGFRYVYANSGSGGMDTDVAWLNDSTRQRQVHGHANERYNGLVPCIQ